MTLLGGGGFITLAMGNQEFAIDARKSSWVYIADSDIEVSRSIQLLLNAEGISVRVFKTGKLLLATAIKIPPSCIIVDASLPDIDGPCILARLREHSIQVPVIMLISSSGESIPDGIAHAVKSLKAGAWDYFEKPFMQRRLVDRVERAINQHH